VDRSRIGSRHDKSDSGRGKESTSVEFESLGHEARYAIEEARMVLPGIQALFGFQLIAVFNQRFAQLGGGEQALHLGALILTGLSIALIMTPAAYHRQAEPGRISPYFLALTSALLTLAMLPLALAISVDTFIVSDIVLDDLAASAALAGGLLCVYVGAWFVFPRLRRSRQ
jgi:hypothetical protein